MFICADVAALRLRLLDMPIKQFDFVIELAYQTRSMMAELEGEPHLLTGQALLRAMAVWLPDAVPEFERAECGTLPRAYTHVESKE